MKIMNRVTWEYLKKNKRRTVVTILGVIISVAMITAISTFFGTFMDWMRRDLIARDGDWQIQYVDVKMADVQTIEEDENTAETALERQLGFGQLRPETEDEVASYLRIQEYSAEGFPFRRLQIMEGRLPENGSELVVSQYAVNGMGQEIQIGDVITLPIGKRFNQYGEPIDRYASGWDETFVPSQTKEYTVVGLLDGHNLSSYDAYSFLDTGSLSGEDSVTVTTRVKHVDAGIFKQGDALGDGIAGQVTYNYELLRCMGILSDSYLSETFLILTLIVGTIVMIGSVMLIYNAFAISISERSRQLGMLSSVGATKKQKRNSVFFEGTVIGAVAIPLGILFGIVGIGITFYLVDPMIRNVLSISAPLRLKVEPIAVVGAVIFSVLTIFISLWIPAKRASRITPIDAIRQTQDVKLKGRQVKTSRLTRKIFGFEGELALKNLKRNKKRYRVTILSLTVSIVLFLTAASFTHFINKSFELTTMDIRYDLMVNIYGEDSETVDDLVRQIRSLDSVKEAATSRTLSAQADLSAGQITPQAREYGYSPDGNSYNYGVVLRILDNETLTKYADQLGVDLARLKDTSRPAGILQNTVKYKKGHFYEELSFLTGEVDHLSLYSQEYDEESDSVLKHEFGLEIAALTGEIPITDMSLSADASVLTLFISEEVYEKIWAEAYNTPYFAEWGGPNEFTTVVVSKDNKMAETDINSLIETQFASRKFYVNNIAQALAQETQLATIVGIFVYGFVALITLISIANIFNTISTSIALRRREFAMLRSVGMTPGGFNRMIRFESIFYGLKALLYGLPLSAVSMFLMYQALSRNFDFVFSLPWGPIFGVIAGVFLIVGLTMLYSGSKIRKSNIIDSLTEENL